MAAGPASSSTSNIEEALLVDLYAGFTLFTYACRVTIILLDWNVEEGYYPDLL